MFIVVTGKSSRMHEVNAYLYEGQAVFTGPHETRFDGLSVSVVDTGSADKYRAEYVRDRLGSGMFGAVLFESIDEALDYAKNEKL